MLFNMMLQVCLWRKKHLLCERNESMKSLSMKRFMVRLVAFMAAFLLLAAGAYWIIKDDWALTAVQTDSVSMGYLLPAGSEVAQAIDLPMDGLERVTIVPHFDTAERDGQVTVSLLDGSEVLWTAEVPAAELVSDKENEIAVEPVIRDKAALTLLVQPNETGLALWAGTTMSAGKFDVSVSTAGLQVNGETAEGSLVLSLTGHNVLNAQRWYWPVAAVLLVLSTGLICLTHVQLKRGKRSLLTMVVTLYNQYKYLLKQLVDRDFRVKYKASALGMIWSFLNPLLTMMVYLLVFSTIFSSDIEYFPVYLMSGIVLFSYFSDATNLGMGSIVGNSALITKVYMPKMIYPLSKVLSSAINFCISLIPLFLVMLLTGVPIHKSILLLPVVILFLLVFSFGMSLILATLNVFFRDTQFLWGVLLTLVNFLTPVFYPESIIPAQFLTLYHMNPLYQIIYFMRKIILDGVSPTPVTYLYCIVSSGLTLLFGIWVFRKNQDRFVLYL